MDFKAALGPTPPTHRSSGVSPVVSWRQKEQEKIKGGRACMLGQKTSDSKRGKVPSRALPLQVRAGGKSAEKF
jgi:hypothetical protein